MFLHHSIESVSQVDIFLWPCLAVLLERYLYEVGSSRSPWKFWGARRQDDIQMVTPGVAISIRNLGKDFKTSFFGSKFVTAIQDLTLDIPKNGIYVLLGPNG